MSMIQDGTGSGKWLKISGDNRIYSTVVSETESQHGAELADAYNINTGTTSLTGAADTAILYLKNNEDRDLIITAIAVGLGTGTQSDSAHVTIVRNPTAGTTIDGNTTVAMNQNRNFGSSKTLSVDALVGADGETLTDGSDVGVLYMTAGSRLYATLDLVLTKGDSVGIKIDPNLSSGSVNAYAAFICHLKDSNLVS